MAPSGMARFPQLDSTCNTWNTCPCQVQTVIENYTDAVGLTSARGIEVNGAVPVVHINDVWLGGLLNVRPYRKIQHHLQVHIHA